MENQKPRDKGDYGITPTEEEKKRLAEVDKKAGLDANADPGQKQNDLESGDNSDQRETEAAARKQQQQDGQTLGEQT